MPHDIPNNNQQQYQCPNVDCDNCQLYNEDELSRLGQPKCPKCKTKLEPFSFVDENELEDEEEEYEEDDDINIPIDDDDITVD